MANRSDSLWNRWKDALILMRIPFSVFLMPVYWFALSQTDFEVGKALCVFIILHVFLYPASNGYNSFFDRDESSIGGLKNPPAVGRELWWLVCFFDLITLLLSAGIGLGFSFMIFCYMLASKAYSWKETRLKKYPLFGALTVIFFQGFFTYLTVQVGISNTVAFNSNNLLMALVSSLFLAGSYPVTQIYQHSEDRKHGDRTLSLMLGIQGTFLFAGIAFFLASVLMVWGLLQAGDTIHVVVYLVAMAPVAVSFFSWYRDFSIGKNVITHRRTMQLNAVSSLMLSLAFLGMLAIRLVR